MVRSHRRLIILGKKDFTRWHSVLAHLFSFWVQTRDQIATSHARDTSDAEPAVQ